MMDVEERPEVLNGCTIKIKIPSSEHAVYLTVNDIEVDGQLRPYEIFLNSKNIENYMWVNTVMRETSLIFRMCPKEIIIKLIEDLKNVADPSGNGSYFRKGVMMKSLVSDIAIQLESHLKHIGIIG